MNAQPHLNPDVRHDALLLVEVIDSNPNGDPDAGNQPRIDPETGHGLITDVSLKRKVRDTVDLMRATLPHPDRYGIYVTAGTALNTIHEARQGSGCRQRRPRETRQEWLRDHYFDIRMFGAVMTTGTKEYWAGRVTGPVQFGMARSLDPIVPTELAITRVTKTVEGHEDAVRDGLTNGSSPTACTRPASTTPPPVGRPTASPAMTSNCSGQRCTPCGTTHAQQPGQT